MVKFGEFLKITKGGGNVIGEYSHSVDGKGRIFIPAKFRERLGPVFYMTRGLEEFISVYNPEEWEKLKAWILTFDYEETLKLQQYYMAPAQECIPDSQGRVLIPPKLRAHAKLEKGASILGMGDHIEIWNDVEWNKTDPTSDDIKAIIRKRRSQ